MYFYLERLIWKIQFRKYFSIFRSNFRDNRKIDIVLCSKMNIHRNIKCWFIFVSMECQHLYHITISYYKKLKKHLQSWSYTKKELTIAQRFSCTTIWTSLTVQYFFKSKKNCTLKHFRYLHLLKNCLRKTFSLFRKKFWVTKSILKTRERSKIFYSSTDNRGYMK